MSEEEKQEERKVENQATKENAQSTIETGTLQDQKNTISSSQTKSKTKKKKPSEIQVDSNKTKNKLKNTNSSQTLK